MLFFAIICVSLILVHIIFIVPLENATEALYSKLTDDELEDIVRENEGFLDRDTWASKELARRKGF